MRGRASVKARIARPAVADEQDDDETEAETEPGGTPDERRDGLAETEPAEPPAPAPEAEQDNETEPGGTPDVRALPAPKTTTTKAPATRRILSQVTDAEDQSLVDWLNGLGEQGSYQVSLSRTKPEQWRDPVTGEEHQVGGHLYTYEQAITEDQIFRDHGGGLFSLRIKKRDERGSFVYAKGFHRTVLVAGDPKPKRHTQPPPQQQSAPPAAPTENASVVRHAMDMMAQAYERTQGGGMDPTMRMMFEQMRTQYERQAERQAEEVAELRKNLATLQNTKPPEDPIKDKMLSTLIDGESGRITSLQARHESELRQFKEGHAQDLRRLEDRHDRVLADIRAQHDRQIDIMRQGYEREIAALRASHDVVRESQKSTQEVQAHTLKADITRLERDNAELRAEVRELREKKDKSPFELLKDAKALKEAISDGDEGGDTSTIAKVVDAISSPAVMETVGRVFSRGPAAPQQPAAQPAAAAPARPMVVRDPRTGQQFVTAPTPQGGVGLVPVKRKPKVITTDAGNQIEVPAMDPGDVKTLVAYLEAAYSGGQDPQVLAQSTRSRVPEPIIAWIKENTTADASGVDLFMRKVANLPSTSPLSTQAGKTWLRKVGKALIGETDE